MTSTNDTLTDIDRKAREYDSIPRRLSVLPLRDIVIFPNMIFPILIGRDSSLKAVAKALERDKFIFLTAQKDVGIDEPGKDDLHRFGTVAKIIQLIRLPNNLLKILVDGVAQGRVRRFYSTKDHLDGDIELNNSDQSDETSPEMQAMIRHAIELFHKYVKVNRNVPPEVSMAFDNIDDPGRKLYYAAANIQQDVASKQRILEKFSLKEQYFELISILTSEIEVLEIEQDIDVRVHDTIQKAQKRFFIQEQIRALQQELGDDDEAFPELGKLRERLDQAGLPESVKTRVDEEFQKLKKMPMMSPDFGVIRNYLDWISRVPWQERTEDQLDIEHVREVLDADHYGLDKVKDRILEYIAVLNLTQNISGQVLCFVGPPGVGKTSLAKSIARALGRKFVRISLGGVRDEAEIRGHRRTYIGSMPGKIIQSMKRAETVNPLMLLDEVDKMAMDFRGDPSSALLEVLDPEQNQTFNDHYLEVDYDLANVLFICTANVKYDIPAPLLDRMEIIELSSYLEPEKIQIAQRHIIPRQLNKQGLGEFDVKLNDKALQTIVREYTREAGVRNLERQIASVFRKIAKQVVSDKARSSSKKNKYNITSDKVREMLKSPPFPEKRKELSDKVGVVTGLAWTSTGGDVLPVQVTMMPGKEKLTLTGKLGDVMKESAAAALSYVRSNWRELNVPEDFAKDREIHLHVPEGAIPKDGPSAGITITMALISAAANRAARGDVAMTGEITLRGEVLAIGGLIEKLLAAKRMGMQTVLIPRDNQQQLADIKDDVKKGLEIVPVADALSALPHVFR